MGSSIGIVRAENKMAEWLMRIGAAKSESQAQYILLGVAAGAVLLGVAGWFILNPSSGDTKPGDPSLLRAPNASPTPPRTTF